MNACQACDGRAEHLHHIVPRSQGGSDDFRNLARLCRYCHADWHDRDVIHSDILSAVQIDYVLQSKGATWLHRNYPPRTSPF